MNNVDTRIVVAHVVVNLDIGGLERVVLNIIRSTDDHRFRSILVCLRDGGDLTDEIDQSHTKIFAMNKKDRMEYALFFRLARILKNENVHIVHCHNFGPLIYGSVAGRLAACKVLYTAHGKYSARRLGRSRVLKFGRLDHIVAVSEDSRQVAINEAGRSPDEVETLINGVDVDSFETTGARSQMRHDLGIANDAPVFGIVARLTAVKDHAMLIRAFVKVRAACPSAILLIIGDGELEGPLLEQVTALGPNSGIKMLGARRDISLLLEAMDVFVLSSYSEGLSVTLLEASAARLPIVATNIGGNPEVVLDRETGRIVPERDDTAMAEAMIWMADNLDKGAQMGELGRIRVNEQFGVHRMVSRYEQIYESLAGGLGS